MKQQVHLVSLGVGDVAAARRFYCDGLGKDPDGHIWEVAPGGLAFDETGRAILG